MTILFIGQKGLRLLPRLDLTMREERIAAVGHALAKEGHEVTVLGTAPYHTRPTLQVAGVTLKRLPSLNPDKPGGWLYTFLSFFTLWRRQPHVVHLHGWRAASLLWLAAILSPESTFVWTIDSLPSGAFYRSRLVVWQAQRLADAITVPTRTLQYLLLHGIGLRTMYIPDGYIPSRLPALSLRAFGLRRQGYVLALTSTNKLNPLVQAYKQSKSRKKLVVVGSSVPARLSQLQKRYPFLHWVTPGNRELQTLMQHAHSVVIADEGIPLALLLRAMAAGKPIVAPNDPVYQETLGVAGRVYKLGKGAALADELRTLNKGSRGLGARAAHRASTHFTWSRITPEYATLYRHAKPVLVPLDSVRPVSFTQAA